MKILLITSSYGIFRDSHTIRLKNMLSRLGPDYSVTVCYPGFSDNNSIEQFDSFYLRPNLRLSFLNFLSTINESIFLAFTNVFRRVSNPDLFSGFSKKVLKHFLVHDFDYDLILTASGSLESHIAGRLLSERFGCPFYMDYGDPIHTLISDQKKRNEIKEIERLNLNKARGIIFTTNSTAEQYEEIFQLKGIVKVIRYGYDLDHIDRISDADLCNNIPFSKDVKYLSHIGTAFTNDRDLRHFITALSKVQKDENVGLILAGRRSRVFSLFAKEVGIKEFIDLGITSFEFSIFLQKKSYINIIVGNKDPKQVPGKVFIAMACRQPIIYIKQAMSDIDEALVILNDYSMLVTCDNNADSIVAAIKEVGSKLALGFEEYDGKKYDSNMLSDEFKDIINEGRSN